MFKLDWLRGNALTTNGLPMGTFDSGVVCPDGTVMWLWSEDDTFSNRLGDADRCPSHRSSSTVDHSPEQIHYHYHRFGMGPWLLVGLQLSLAIALMLILSAPQPSEQDAPLDSLVNPQPDYLIGFLY